MLQDLWKTTLSSLANPRFRGFTPFKHIWTWCLSSIGAILKSIEGIMPAENLHAGHDPWEDNLIQLGQCYCYTPFQVIWAWRLLTKYDRNFDWSKWEAYAKFTNDIWGVDLRIDGYSLKDFVGIPPFYTFLQFISSSSSLHRIFRFQNFWQPKQQSMNRQQSESPLLLLLLLVCWFHLVFYSTDCSTGLDVQKSIADVQKSRASPPCHSFWRLHTAAALQSKSKVQQSKSKVQQSNSSPRRHAACHQSTWCRIMG